jgi:hypothetical protein
VRLDRGVARRALLLLRLRWIGWGVSHPVPVIARTVSTAPGLCRTGGYGF